MYLKNLVNVKLCRYENFKDCVDIICFKSEVIYYNNFDLNNRYMFLWFFMGIDIRCLG